MHSANYILLEGLPGGGKTCLIKLLRARNISFSLLPDFGNPKDLSAHFHMDHNWVIDIECLKSQLALRARYPLTIQERGYLSILACHAMLDNIAHENKYDVILNRLKECVNRAKLVIPDRIIVSRIEPIQSIKNQPHTQLKIWKDVAMLEKIQDYYISYAKKPIFGETVIVIDWRKLPSEAFNILL